MDGAGQPPTPQPRRPGQADKRAKVEALFSVVLPAHDTHMMRRNQAPGERWGFAIISVTIRRACPAGIMKGSFMRVVLAQPRGFCAGVERAIEIVERALEKYGPPIYVRHGIVHNRNVVESLRAKGAQFVDELDEIPPGSATIFSAHGVANAVETAAEDRGLPVIDPTVPPVTK